MSYLAEMAYKLLPTKNVDTTQTTHVSLCAGYGGIDIGLKRAIPNLRTIAFSEIEAFVCANLVAKMEAGLLDCAPIWSNLKTFPWASFRGQVDILSGGYPCQPFSAAGKRLGADDPRHLWPYIADGIRAMQPRICFFENVEGHISLGLRAVLSELESIGYRTAWGIFSAAEVGAPHRRKRVFIMANSKQSTDRSETAWDEVIRSHASRPTGGSCGSSGELAKSRSQRSAAGFPGQEQGQEGQSGVVDHGGHTCWPSRPGEAQHAWEPPRVVSGLANSTSAGSWSESGDAVHQGWSSSDAWSASVSQDAERQAGAAISDDQSTGRDGEPPRVVGNADTTVRHGAERPQRPAGYLPCGSGEGMGNTDCGRQSLSIDTRSCSETISRGEGNIEQTECRQAQPALGRDADGSASGMDYAKLCIAGDNRTDELRLLGNGVVPATAELAFRTLAERLFKP